MDISMKIKGMLSLLLVSTLSTGAFAVIAELPPGLFNEDVSAIKAEADVALPEYLDVDQSYLNTSYNPNLKLIQDAHVYVSFIDEGAGYKNTLGYFTFNDQSFAGLKHGDINTDNSGSGVSLDELLHIDGVEVGLVFPNSSLNGTSGLKSGGLLNSGDTISLGSGTLFSADVNLGFFLIQKGWSSWDQTVKSYEDGDDRDPLIFYTIDFLNPENGTDDDSLSDSLALNSRHVAMQFASDQESIVMGFEDLHRNHGSDDDFNDAIFKVYTDPASSISTTNIPTIPEPATILILGAGAMLGMKRRNA